jgi:hypothetical protein
MIFQAFSYLLEEDKVKLKPALKIRKRVRVTSMVPMAMPRLTKTSEAKIL